MSRHSSNGKTFLLTTIDRQLIVEALEIYLLQLNETNTTQLTIDWIKDLREYILTKRK